MTRAEEISDFLAREGWGWAERTPLAGDASARRYERLKRGFQHAILMDMPPESGLDIRPFLAVTAWLRAGRFSAPEVLGADRARGLALLEDLGDDLFATLCAERPTPRARPLPRRRRDPRRAPAPPAPRRGRGLDPAALRPRLPDARGPPRPGMVPPRRHRRRRPARPRRRVRRPARARPRRRSPRRAVPVLRDYHAENLLWLPRRRDHARVGMLDYQDMLLGHPAYDLMSLLEDARRDASPALRAGMLDRYLELTGADPETFTRRGRASSPPSATSRSSASSPASAAATASRATSPTSPASGRTSPATSPTPRSPPSPPSSPATSPRPSPRSSPASRPPHDARAVMIFAAGLGTRMGELTRDRPKPLIEVAGRPLIDHALALARAAGIPRIVVNTHAHAEQMRAHLARTAPDVLHLPRARRSSRPAAA